ncbi:YaeQ family protein [Nitrogeniibacter mangrovi]|uniref:YaeQ family protein n=1 Tax=Nitrogeniibacter mangrovi TaxID=2016596 RepID=A0A6C1B8C2_9RHOO|nr:YaeQ family protein [Nitrogeniibacter mangrovi]QID19189.1 YaeQ family protein [Nitrogeniibacter mangrovi]
MALKSTVFKFQLQIADLDRHYYADHALTLARHPSETDERLVARVLAFARIAGEGIDMSSALCEPDEPDLCVRTLDGRITHWIDVGQPEARRVLKAAGRADRVTLHPYGGSTSTLWWEGVRKELLRVRKLEVIAFPEAAVKALAASVARTCQWQITVQDGTMMVSTGTDCVSVEPDTWRPIAH